jgi:pimeloyl-ACP methyl ester carboxylesterase
MHALPRPAAIAAALLMAVASMTAAAVEGTARLPLSECRLPIPAGLGSVPARCGTLEVAENPAEPRGPHIRLAVAVVPGLAVARGTPPLFVVAGGPGQSARDFYAALAGAFAPTAQKRDLVLVDQRGTGGSNALRCDFPDDFDVASPPPAVVRELSAKCRAGLTGRPAFYTTSVAVGDLDAVRSALGYPRIALYGVSYGTRVVEHYLRRHADHVAAVVLDGVLPPDRPLGADTPLDAERALGLMFARCQREAACDRAFPELAARFRRLLAEVTAHPVRVTVADPADGKPATVEFDRAQFAGAVRLLNYYTATTALLPYFIDRASHGDFAPFASQLVALGEHLGDQLAYGMNAAVSCSEDVPSYVRADRARLADTYLGTEQLDELATLCEGWPKGVVDADLFAPLASDVPALLLSGEADPVTPPAAAARAAAGFPHGLSVVVRGQGHGQLAVGCAPRLVASFLEALSTAGLDTKCLDAADADPFVVDLGGPAP